VPGVSGGARRHPASVPPGNRSVIATAVTPIAAAIVTRIAAGARRSVMPKRLPAPASSACGVDLGEEGVDELFGVEAGVVFLFALLDELLGLQHRARPSGVTAVFGETGHEAGVRVVAQTRLDRFPSDGEVPPKQRAEVQPQPRENG
jgi:hypothetical protein